MTVSLPTDRLLAIIRTQNEIAASALDLDAVMGLVLERAEALTGAEACVVELADGDDMVYHVARGTAARHIGLRLRMDGSLSGRSVKEKRILHCIDARSDDRVDFEACLQVGAISIVCVPLQHQGRVIGVLKVYDQRPEAFSYQDVAALELLSGVIGAHLAHAADYQVREHESRHDLLTGLPNRRAFEERLDAEVKRVNRHGGTLAVCLLDLDGFKPVNDSEGHAAGDAVLQAVADSLAQVRGEDTAYRTGGDEFALILVETSVGGAANAVGRVMHGIRTNPAARAVGASYGIAEFRQHDDASSMVARADAALYSAKRSPADSAQAS